jgi:predicted esterase
MSKINELRAAIEALTEEEYIQLRRWFSEKDWGKWDRQIELDSESGKLDFLIREAFDEKKKGKLKEL